VGPPWTSTATTRRTTKKQGEPSTGGEPNSNSNDESRSRGLSERLKQYLASRKPQSGSSSKSVNSPNKNIDSVYNAIFNASISSQTCYDLNGNREAKNSANLGNFLSDNRIDTCTVRTVCVQYLNKTCPIALTPVPLAAGHVPPSIR
jgi:hypothetical protein